MKVQTLILTPWMAPHRVVPWEEGISKLYEGKCEVIAEYEETVSSPSMTMRIPAVLRSKRPTPSMKKAVKFSRANVYARDGFRCQYCGVVKRDSRELNYDHVVPRSRGGPKTWENIVTACYPCNDKKHNRTPAEAGMTLRRLPVKPKTLPMTALVVKLDRAVPEEWAAYLQTA